MSKRSKKVTSGTAWRRKSRKTSLIELPSGMIARLRPVSIDALIVSGDLPDVLSTLAAQTLFAEIDFDEIAAQGKTSKSYVTLINQVVPASFEEPRVVEDPQGSDEIALSDIEWADKVLVFQLALAPTDALESFRQEQERSMEDLPDGDDDVAESEQAA